MRALALVPLLLFPLAEIALFALAGRALGVWPTVALTVATSALGLILLRRQGLRAASLLAEGSVAPAPRVADAAGRSLGALLLVLPGFLTDAIGLLLLVPAIRRLLGASAWGYLRRHARVVVATADGGRPRPPGTGPVIDGEAIVVDPPRSRPAPPTEPPRLPPER
ncbi:MAG: FxsA family protein [Alphaproteobacteria bacterium]